MIQALPETLRVLLDPPADARAHPRHPGLWVRRRAAAEGASPPARGDVQGVLGEGRFDWLFRLPGSAGSAVLWADGRHAVVRIAHDDPGGESAPLLRASMELRLRLLQHPLIPHARRIEARRRAGGWRLRVAAGNDEAEWGSGEDGDPLLETPHDVEARTSAFITAATGWRIVRCGECGGTRAHRPGAYAPPPPCGRCGAAAAAWRCGGCGLLLAEPRPTGEGVSACAACRPRVYEADTWPWAWLRQTAGRLDSALAGLLAAGSAVALEDPAAAARALSGLYRLSESGPGSPPDASAVRRLLARPGAEGALGALVLGAWGIYRAPGDLASLAAEGSPPAVVRSLVGALAPFHMGALPAPRGPGSFAPVAVALRQHLPAGAAPFADWLARGAGESLPAPFEVEAAAWTGAVQGDVLGSFHASEARVLAAYLHGARLGIAATALPGTVEHRALLAVRGALGQVTPPGPDPGAWLGYAVRAYGEELGLGTAAAAVVGGRSA
ncbi:hypothetical protein L6R50_17195 [Myxococcota bacterium]|nr:hypothetical protein [Myxococcota bacterium]